MSAVQQAPNEERILNLAEQKLAAGDREGAQKLAAGVLAAQSWRRCAGARCIHLGANLPLSPGTWKKPALVLSRRCNRERLANACLEPHLSGPDL